MWVLSLKRYLPSEKLNYKPCSYVAVATAFEDYFKKPFEEGVPEGLRLNGYLTLDNQNKYIRRYLPVKKKVYYAKKGRPNLKEFLKDNTQKCIICVIGHYIYADNDNYYSFLNNDLDDVVCVWLLK